MASEAEAFALLCRFLSYLPGSVDELPERTTPIDDPARREEGLIEAGPRNPRHLNPMRPIVEVLVDHGSIFDIGRRHGAGIITGFARSDGWPVAVLASDPMTLGELWSAATAR